jgi:HK97 family phage portal protein
VHQVGADGYVVAFGRGWPNPYGAKTGTREVPRGADLMHISADGDEWSASPIERFRVLLATAIAEQRLGAETYSRGARVQNVLTHPQRLNSDQKRELRDSWESMHEGTGARRTAILDGGIDLKSVSMTLSDAQWIQSRGLTAQEVARALHWPASLLDALSKGSITPELEDIRTSRWYVMPRLLRLEDAFNADPWLFGAGSRDRLVLDPMPVRGDLRTEAATDVALVQVGIELVDETRARRGLDPLPGGVGQIPQITPVGGAPNPLSLAPDPAPAE